MMKLRLKKKGLFTLIEMVVSLGVFSILMLIMFQLFTSAQKAWLISKSRADAYENAKIALDLITRDLQCISYVQDDVVIPFWHGSYAGSDDYSNNDILAFVSTTPVPPSGTSSLLCEVKYQLAYVADHTPPTPPTPRKDGWLRRSVTGDNDAKWNYITYSVPPVVALTGVASAFTADNTSSADYQNLIPNVIELSFTCYDKTGAPLSSTGSPAVIPPPLPFSIKISLTLMDKGSWDKWCALCGTSFTYPITVDAIGGSEPVPAYDFRKKNQKTFTKTVFIGNRG